MILNKKLVTIAFVLVGITAFAQHPSLMITKASLPAVREGVKKYPLFASSYATVEAKADAALKEPINVPTPKDGGGGYTHEQHKKNYQNMLACGTAYQITKKAKYAKYVKDMLLTYAELYNTWPEHPKRKKGHMGGKIFWQNLNDCVWLVYTIQAYDLVFDYLSANDRNNIQKNLWEPVIKELTVANYDIFNKVHNHGTWSCAAVGMTGYVTGRKDWVEMALKGSDKDGKAGFLKQIDQLFSPDGYFAEGPYYQRYAIQPFIIFARAIQQYQPEIKIYAYRDSLLKKAVNTALQTTYTNKVFFPLNDALKDKTYETEELVYAVDIAYGDIYAANDLLDIAQQQKRVIVSTAGLKVAKAIAEKKTISFKYKPMLIRDGADGNAGGIGVLRTGPNTNQTTVVMKATAQGMGHGHFDKLNVLFYDNGVEVFSDYGAARFLNVETKTGGGYTKENETFAKQTIAHNTVTIDKKSHFNGDVDTAENYHSDVLYFEANKNFQVVSGEDINADKSVKMRRTAILYKPKEAGSPLLIDVFNLFSDTKHSYDLPFWYQGHIVNTPFSMVNGSQLNAFGKSHGYEHIWHTATGNIKDKSNAAITILNNKKFYTTTFLCNAGTKIHFAMSGANDPQMNLRNEKAFILSETDKANHTFVNITEPHGANNPIAEFTTGATPMVSDIVLVKNEKDTSIVSFKYNKTVYTITLNYTDKNNFITIK